MLVDLRGRDGTAVPLLLTCQITLLTFIILVTTVSCSTPDIREPRMEPWFSDRVTDVPNPELVQRSEPQPKLRREQPRTSASPKVATVHTPRATTGSVSRPASKKMNTPPRIDAQKEQLFREFQQWQKRERDLP
jgi:hypothetical protein